MSRIEEEIARCDREITQCLEYQENKSNPIEERRMAAQGEVDWMIARMYLTGEFD